MKKLTFAAASKKLTFAVTALLMTGALATTGCDEKGNEDQNETAAYEESEETPPATPELDDSDAMMGAEDGVDKAMEEGVAASEEGYVYEIVIKDHVFTPSEIKVPAGEALKLVVDNQDSTPEEFESDDFRREKIIPGNSKATINVGPLEPGTYKFFGEFNEDTAQGTLIAE